MRRLRARLLFVLGGAWLGGACTVVDSLDGFAGPPAESAAGSSGADSGSGGGSLLDGGGAVCADNPDCDDQNPCTDDVCWANQCLYYAKPGQPCGNDDLCDGDERCDDDGACQPGAPPNLDDGNDCTVDYCDAQLGPRHEPANNPPVNVCIAGTSSCPAGYYAESLLLCDAACGACPFCVNGLRCVRACTETITACCVNEENCPTICPSGYKYQKTVKSLVCGCAVEGPAAICQRS